MEESYPKDQIEDRKTNKEEPQTSEEQEKFEREYYNSAVISRTTNIIGWTIATILFIIAIWLLWAALR
ncbi:MAG: hypothetical protein Q7S37_04295 [bacterium]|nr:hypothetical protein [bacterium]